MNKNDVTYTLPIIKKITGTTIFNGVIIDESLEEYAKDLLKRKALNEVFKPEELLKNLIKNTSRHFLVEDFLELEIKETEKYTFLKICPIEAPTCFSKYLKEIE